MAPLHALYVPLMMEEQCVHLEAASGHDSFCPQFVALTLLLHWLLCITNMAVACGYMEYGTSMADLHSLYVPLLVGSQ